MLILAHLLCGNRPWARTRIRVLRECRPEEEQDAHNELENLVDAARIDAEVKVVVSERPFAEVLAEESGTRPWSSSASACSPAARPPPSSSSSRS